MNRRGYVIRICDDYYIKGLSRRYKSEASITDSISDAMVCSREDAVILCDKFSNNKSEIIRISLNKINELKW